MDSIRVLIVPKYDDFDRANYESDLREIENNIHLVMGASCKVEITFVKDIPTSISGKHQYLISKMKDTPTSV